MRETDCMSLSCRDTRALFVKKRLSGFNFLGCSLSSIVHYRHRTVVDMGNDLVPEREESNFMGIFVLVDMGRSYCQGPVAFGFDLLSGDGLIIFPDIDHQHVYMQ